MSVFHIIYTSHPFGFDESTLAVSTRFGLTLAFPRSLPKFIVSVAVEMPATEN